MGPVLHGTQTTLRPVTPQDGPRLAEILGHPEVSRWWPRYDAERVQRDLVEAPGTVVFVIECGGEVVGSVQYVEEPAPDYRHASIDVFLDPAWHGRGLGSDAVRTVARYLVHDRAHHRLAIDPAADNAKAIAAYKRVGFREVGVMRQYERGSDGEWHDGMLMELLARDLR